MGRNHTRVGLDIGISAEPHPWDLSTRELTSELSGGLSHVHSEENHWRSGELEPWQSSSRGGCRNATRGSLFSPSSLSSEPCPATANYKPSRLPHSPPTSPRSDSSSPHFPIKGITPGPLHPPLASTFDATNDAPFSCQCGNRGDRKSVV